MEEASHDGHPPDREPVVREERLHLVRHERRAEVREDAVWTPWGGAGQAPRTTAARNQYRGRGRQRNPVQRTGGGVETRWDVGG